MIHRNSRTREATSSSTTIRYLDWNSGLVVSAEEDQHRDRMCGLQDIGGHLMKIPVIGFQVLLCMRLEVCYVMLCSWFVGHHGSYLGHLINWPVILNFREPQQMLDISHFQFSSLLFFYSKVPVYYFLHVGWWRKLYFCCVVGLAPEYILEFLPRLTTALGFCTMVPGSNFVFCFY